MGDSGVILRCPLVVETLRPTDDSVLKKDSFKRASLTLARNEFRELLLSVSEEAKDNLTRRLLVPVRQEHLVVHRKFAQDGKATVKIVNARKVLMISNAPPGDLVRFLKVLAAKLAGSAIHPVMSARNKLMSSLPNVLEDISPVTLKDVHHLKKAEIEKKGVLKIKTLSPVAVATPPSLSKSKKRSRLFDRDDKENIPPDASPLRKSPRIAAQGDRTPHKPRGKPSSLFASRSELTAEQKTVLDAVRSGRNVFFTGGAGVGKSFLLRKIIALLPPDSTFVTASTGVAAFNVAGMTLHAFAGVGTGTAPVEQCVDMVKKKKGVIDIWRKCKHLLIDEVSMVDGKFFDKLEAIARALRCNDRPFGGIQLILTGDFLQLPPVTKGKEERVYCFETEAWRSCVHVSVELTQIKRQTDPAFIAILRAMRVGQCTPDHIRTLRATSEHVVNAEGIVATRLCTHTADAERINVARMKSLQGAERLFEASDSDPVLSSYLDTHTPVDARIVLKVGAQVMLVRNQNMAKGLVNGARGRVVEFDRNTGFPVVQFVCGPKQIVQMEKWNVKTSGGLTLTRRQIPLRLAWAFSIHKSQGMTLDCVEMNLSKVFECGQAYVALSRAKNLNAVKITDFDPESIKADRKVLKFYRNLSCTIPTAVTQ